MNKKRLSDIIEKGAVISYPYNKKRVECMVREIKGSVITLLPCRSNDQITTDKGLSRDVSTSTLNRLGKFLYYTAQLYEI